MQKRRILATICFAGTFGFEILSIGASFAETPISILVNPGDLGSIEEAGRAEERVDWWDGDTSDDNACTECFAALELRHFLAACTGVEESSISLIPPDMGLPSEGAVFVLGNRNSNPLIGHLNADSQSDLGATESYSLRASRQDDRVVCIIEGGDRIGTLYGVYDYLERLGMRFYGLGEQGTVYPTPPVTLPDDLAIEGRPGFETRGFWSWEDRGDDPFLMWMTRNRLNYWSAAQSNTHFCKKIGLRFVIGGHEPTKLFLDPEQDYPYNHPLYEGDEGKPDDPYQAPPSQEYAGDSDGDGKLQTFEAHPEWYGLLDGTRRRKIDLLFGDCNFCTSNKDAVDFLAKNFVQSLIGGTWKNADIVNFWALDARPWCQCENCTASGDLTYRLLTVVDQVERVVRKAREEGRLNRQVLLHTCAYHETLQPPEKPLAEDFNYDTIAVTVYPIGRSYTCPLGDPASTEVNRYNSECFLGWGHSQNYKGAICVGEYYNVSRLRTLPIVYKTIMAADIPWYHRNGARHFQYMHTPTQNWGTWTLNQCLMARLLWDLDLDSDAFLGDYFENFYPTTSEKTRSFYDHLEKAPANIKAIKHYLESPQFDKKYYSLRNQIEGLKEDLFLTKTLRYEEFHPVTDDGIDFVQSLDELHFARKDLDSALLHCQDEKERRRLLEDEKRFAYGEAVFEFYNHMIRALTFHHRSPEESAALEVQKADRLAEVLKAMIDVVQGAGEHGSDVNAFEATQITQAFEFLKAKYGRAQP